jgi:hypothetical protein
MLAFLDGEESVIGYHFQISEPSAEGFEGRVAMNGQRLYGVRCVTVVGRAGELNVVTIEFAAASVNRGAFAEIQALPLLEPKP